MNAETNKSATARLTMKALPRRLRGLYANTDPITKVFPITPTVLNKMVTTRRQVFTTTSVENGLKKTSSVGKISELSIVSNRRQCWAAHSKTQ